MSTYDADKAYAQGWMIFESDTEGGSELQIQAVVEQNMFGGDDNQAWQFVVDQAKTGDTNCQAALAIIEKESPKEWALILKHTK